MTSSRSSSSWLVLVLTLVMWVGLAEAGRKRVVVLEFEGPKAEKFHEDLVKLLKKNHTVVSVEKWNGVAEELDAGKVTEKNVKKVAKKLKIDGVITGKIDKRRDEYIIKLKLRSGTTGEILGSTINTKADGPRLDGQAQRDIKEELITQIDELDSNRGGDDDDEGDEDKPRKSGFGGGRKSGDDDEEDDAKRKKEEEAKRKEEEQARKDEEKRKKEEEKRKKEEAAKRKAEEEALATKKGGDDDDDEDDEGSRKRKSSDDDDDEGSSRRRKRKASADDDEDDEEGVEDDVEVEDSDRATNLSPGRRAIDATLGMSFTARRLSFQYESGLGSAPPGYKQTIPVAGALVDMTFYPLSFGHKNKTIYSNIGLNILYDRVLKINSQKRYIDPGTQDLRTADLTTSESRWSVGGVFRYPLGTGPKAPVVGGSLSYASQSFTVEQMLPSGEPTDIPNVRYKMFTPAAFVRLPGLLPKINIGLDLAFHAMTSTGDIQEPAQYGYATVTAYEVEPSVDYMIKPNLFARASIRYQSIGIKFKGDPASQTHTRDTDPDQDVTGAKDVYFGGTATIGYVY